jgi:hypothetical protein
LTFPSSNHPKKEEFLNEGLLNNSWNISFYQMEQHVSYGPLTSDKILIFLKNMYATLSPEEKSKKNFMIVDIVNDVYYQPDTLFEILSEQFQKKKAKLSVDKLFDIKLIPQSVLNFPTQKLIRPLLPSGLSKYNMINNDKLAEKPSISIDLQIRKNSNVSSGSNCLSTKYSSIRSEESCVVGLNPKKKKTQKKKSNEKLGMFCGN